MDALNGDDQLVQFCKENLNASVSKPKFSKFKATFFSQEFVTQVKMTRNYISKSTHAIPGITKLYHDGKYIK